MFSNSSGEKSEFNINKSLIENVRPPQQITDGAPLQTDFGLRNPEQQQKSSESSESVKQGFSFSIDDVGRSRSSSIPPLTAGDNSQTITIPDIGAMKILKKPKDSVLKPTKKRSNNPQLKSSQFQFNKESESLQDEASSSGSTVKSFATLVKPPPSKKSQQIEEETF